MPDCIFLYMMYSQVTRIFAIVYFITVVSSCKKEADITIKAQENDVIEVYDFNELKPLLNIEDDNKIHVVNFWATWCAPCIKELPYFEELHSANNNVEVLLVSLDFPDKFESQLIPFVKEKNLSPQVILLDDPNENKWIAEIDESWQGALPATLIYTNAKRAFYAQSFTRESLLKEIEKFTKI